MENNEATIELEIKTEPLKPDTDTTKLPDDDTQNNGNSKPVGGIKISSNHFYKHFLYKLHVRKLNKGFCSAVGIAEEGHWSADEFR